MQLFDVVSAENLSTFITEASIGRLLRITQNTFIYEMANIHRIASLKNISYLNEPGILCAEYTYETKFLILI